MKSWSVGEEDVGSKDVDREVRGDRSPTRPDRLGPDTVVLFGQDGCSILGESVEVVGQLRSASDNPMYELDALFRTDVAGGLGRQQGFSFVISKPLGIARKASEGVEGDVFCQLAERGLSTTLDCQVESVPNQQQRCQLGDGCGAAPQRAAVAAIPRSGSRAPSST